MNKLSKNIYIIEVLLRYEELEANHGSNGCSFCILCATRLGGWQLDFFHGAALQCKSNAICIKQVHWIVAIAG